MSSLSHPTGGILGGPIGLGSAGILGPLGVGAEEEEPIVPVAAPVGSASWLLDLQVGGQVLRYATRTVTVYDSRGRPYLYRAGLADFEVVLTGEQEQQGFRVSDRTLDWAELAADGENLDRATATLRHWEPGEALEGAMVVLAGEVTEPEYADPDAPDVFVGTIQAGIEVDRLYPSEQHQVTISTWDKDITAASETFDETIEGAYYPTIFGYPGEGDVETTTPVPCVPALLVSWQPAAAVSSYLLIGLGELDCTGGQVYVRDVTGPDDPAVGWEQEVLPVTTATDKLGQTVTLVEVPIGTGVNGDLGHEYYVGFSRTSGWGGGSRNADGTLLETLADLALFVQRYSGRRVDAQAQRAEAPHFEGLRIDGLLNDRLMLVPWFESQILPLFPMVRAQTERGLYWRFVNWWATERDALAHLDADLGQVTRVSAIRTPLDQLRNRFSVGFQYSARGKMGARRTLTAESEAVAPWWESPEQLADDRIVGSPALARSQSIYQLREEDTIEARFVWSETTAMAILHYRALRDSFPRRTVMYEGRAAEIRWLKKGDVVTVTDSRAKLSRAVAIVDAVTLSSSRRVRVSLSLLDPRRLS